MDWAAAGVVVTAVGVLEIPLLALSGAAWRWARSVDRRLDNIEARSFLRRADD